MNFLEDASEFGHVRSLVQRGPDGWSELTLYLERWRDRESFHTLIEPYVTAHLRSWPRGSYNAPTRWKRWMLHMYEVLPMSCLTSLSFEHMHGANDLFATKMWKLECLQQLEHLDLSGTKVSSTSLGYLMGGADRMKSLRSLMLNTTPQLFAAQETHDHLEQPRFRTLEVLALKHCGISEKSIQVVTRNEALESLQMLKLSHNPLGEKGLRSLALSTTLGGLTSLDLNDVGLDHRSLLVLGQSSWLPQLIWLSFSLQCGASSGKSALRRFLSMDAISNLRALTISAPWLDDKIAQHIASQPHLGNLNTLVLNQRFDAPRFAGWRIDRTLDFIGLSQLTVKGVEAIATSPYLSQEVTTHWNEYLREMTR